MAGRAACRTPVENDPSATLAAPNGSAHDTSFSPYRSARLSGTMPALDLGCGHETAGSSPYFGSRMKFIGILRVSIFGQTNFM